VAILSDTVQVTGIRCERCVTRLAVALANANLMGEVTLSWDEEKTSRTEILSTLARSGFHELPSS
jgi:hypothetical protein